MIHDPTRRELLATLAAAPLAALYQKPSAPANPRILGQGKADLTAQDLKFLGYLRFPSSNYTGDLGLAQLAFCLRTVGGSPRMFITGEKNGNHPLIELDLGSVAPALTVGSAAQVSLARVWGNVALGFAKLTGDPDGSKGTFLPGGLAWDADENAVAYSYGDVYVPVGSDPSVFKVVLNDATGVAKSYGPWRPDIGGQKFRGAITRIPAAYAKANLSGKSWVMATGQSAGNTGSSFGPNAIAFDMPSVTRRPDSMNDQTDVSIATTVLLNHPLPHQKSRDQRYVYCTLPRRPNGVTEFGTGYDCRVGGAAEQLGIPFWGSQDTGAGTNDGLTGICWVDLPDKEGLLFAAQLTRLPNGEPPEPYSKSGFPHMFYGAAYHNTGPHGALGQECCHGGHDPFWISTGPGSTWRCPMLYIYSPGSFLPVIAGNSKPWEVRPSGDDIEVFSGVENGSYLKRKYAEAGFQGFQLDAVNRRLYGIINARTGADHGLTAPTGGDYPCITVFEVK